ncbi:MAG: hypothetical protein OXG53_05785 [Chloroflexi bacterium]|nr:hypothetical protein [Chloroflexota bacterium]
MSWLPLVFKLSAFLAGCKTLLAYLDPGSGSLIVQILVAVIVGAVATFRLWKARLLSLLGVKQETDDAEDVEDENRDEDRA